jgi:hypothetical protein
VTGEILQKSGMILKERIEDKSANGDKSKHDNKISLILVKKCITSPQSEFFEEMNQPILLILGV